MSESVKDGPILSQARSRSKGPLSDQVADATKPRRQRRSWVDGGPSCIVRRSAAVGGERSFAEACLNGEVAPISAISGTPTVKRTPRGLGQALGPYWTL